MHHSRILLSPRDTIFGHQHLFRLFAESAALASDLSKSNLYHIRLCILKLHHLSHLQHTFTYAVLSFFLKKCRTWDSSTHTLHT